MKVAYRIGGAPVRGSIRSCKPGVGERVSLTPCAETPLGNKVKAADAMVRHRSQISRKRMTLEVLPNGMNFSSILEPG
jgi:hypothetical protein